MGVLWYAGTVFLFRGRLASPSGLAGVRVANLIGLLCCVFFLRTVSCVTGFSGLSILVSPSVFCDVYLSTSFTILFIYIKKVKTTSCPDW